MAGTEVAPPIASTSPCGCSTQGVPVSCICSGYVIRDPWAAVYPPPAAPESFTFDSKGSKNEWTIDHNLGFYPNVTTWAKDPSGNPTVAIQGNVQHTTTNSLVIKFNIPVDGIAYMS